ncbi:NAD(P)H-binding protein [Actinoplanes sp. NPDC051513]|uniref:NAD(P)H-binding protein n=1 Tax=Actinoplanes sp. NPDC051513 TaxID=3363908 RepID=UPI0037A7C8F8
MILVTGATGTIGSALVGQLLARGEEVTALTRDPARIEPRPGLTVTTEIRKASAVFLLAPAGPAIPGIDRALLGRAIEAGAERVVKLSAIATPEAGLNIWHRPGEEAVQASGLSWTILRPTTFASNTLAWRDDIRARRTIPNIFGEGRQGIVDPADVAAVAVEALTTTAHDGRIYTLTGPELLSVPEQAAHLSAVTGTTITTVDIPPAREHFPAEIADMALAGALLVRAGGNAIVTDDVEKVLGRGPGTYRAWAEKNF